MNFEPDFSLLCFASEAGKPENLLTASHFARDVLDLSPTATLMRYYLEPVNYSATVRTTALVAVRPPAVSQQLIGPSLQPAISELIDHSHHYGKSGTSSFINSRAGGVADFKIDWLEPSLQTGYTKRSDAHVKFARDSDKPSRLALTFESGLAANNVNMTLTEEYDSGQPFVEVFTDENLHGRQSSITVSAGTRDLFKVDFARLTVDLAPSSRLQMVLLLATKVVGYLSILRVTDAAFFSLVANSAFGGAPLLAEFKQLVAQIVAEIQVPGSVLHFTLLADNIILNTLATRAAALTRTRVGDAFFDLIARSPVLSADTANVLKRILNRREITTSETVLDAAIAKWRQDVGARLALSAAQSTKELIVAEFAKLATTFQQQLVVNLAGAAASYKTALDTLKFITHNYPPEVAQPTADSKEIYEKARDSCELIINKFAAYVADNLAAQLQASCVKDYPNLQPLINALKEEPIVRADESRRAAIIYVISRSTTGRLDLPHADVIAAALANAAPCIATTPAGTFLLEFAKVIEDGDLWLETLRSVTRPKKDSMREKLFARKDEVTELLSSEILKNTSLAVLISMKMRAAVTVAKQFADLLVAALPQPPAPRDQDRKNVKDAVDRINAVTSTGAATSALKRSDNLLARGQAVSLLANIETGTGILSTSGDVSSREFVAVRVSLKSAIALADTLETLYDKGEAAARAALEKVSTLDPKTLAETQEAILNTDAERIDFIGNLAKDRVTAAQKSAASAGFARANALFATALHAFQAGRATSSLASQEFVDQVLDVFCALFQNLRLEASRLSSATSTTSSVTDFINALHMQTAAAQIAQAYFEIESIWPTHHKTPDCAVQTQLTATENAIAARFAAFVAQRVSRAIPVAAVDAPPNDRNWSEYGTYLEKALASNSLGPSVPLPSDAILDTIVNRGANNPAEVGHLKTYRNLQTKYFDDVVRRPQSLPPGVVILRKFPPLTTRQRLTIFNSLFAAFSGLAPQITELARAPDEKLKQIAVEAYALLTYAYDLVPYKSLPPEEKTLERIVQSMARGGTPIFDIKPNVVDDRDAARFDALRNMLGATRIFFAVVDSFGPLPSVAPLVKVFTNVIDIEQVCYNLLRTMFLFEGDEPPPAKTRTLKVDTQRNLQQQVANWRDLLNDAERRFEPLEIGVRALTAAEQTMMQRLRDELKIETSARVALEKIDAITKSGISLEDSKELADFERLFRNGANLVASYKEIFESIDEISQMADVAAKAGRILSLLPLASEARVLNRVARAIATENNWPEYPAVKRWQAMVTKIDTSVASLSASLTEEQKKQFELDSAALRKKMLEEFGEMAKRVEGQLQDTLKEIEETAKKAKVKEKDVDEFSKKLDKVQRSVSGLADQLDEHGRPVELGKLEDKLETTLELMAATAPDIQSISDRFDIMKKQIKDANKTLQEATSLIESQDTAAMTRTLLASQRGMGGVSASVSELKRITDDVQARLDEATKVNDKYDKKAREIAAVIEKYDSVEIPARELETARIAASVAQVRGIIADQELARSALVTEIGTLKEATDVLKESVRVQTVASNARKSEVATLANQTRNQKSEIERIEKSTADVERDITALTKKLVDVKKEIEEQVPLRSAAVDALKTSAATSLQTITVSTAEIERLARDSKTIEATAKRSAKDIDDFEGEVKKTQQSAEKAMLRLKEMANKVSLETTQKPISQLDQVEVALNKATAILERALLAIARGQPAAPGAPPASGIPGPIPANLQAALAIIASSLQQSVVNLQTTVARFTQTTTAAETEAMIKLIDELSKKKIVTEEQIIDLDARLAALIAQLKTYGGKYKDAVDKSAAATQQYELQIVGIDEKKRDVAATLVRLDELEQSIQSVYKIENGVATGRLIDVANRALVTRNAAAAKLRELNLSADAEPEVRVQALITTADEVKARIAAKTAEIAAAQQSVSDAEAAARADLATRAENIAKIKLLDLPEFVDFQRAIEAEQKTATNKAVAALQIKAKEVFDGVVVESKRIITDQQDSLVLTRQKELDDTRALAVKEIANLELEAAKEVKRIKDAVAAHKTESEKYRLQLDEAQRLDRNSMELDAAQNLARFAVQESVRDAFKEYFDALNSPQVRNLVMDDGSGLFHPSFIDTVRGSWYALTEVVSFMQAARRGWEIDIQHEDTEGFVTGEVIRPETLYATGTLDEPNYVLENFFGRKRGSITIQDRLIVFVVRTLPGRLGALINLAINFLKNFPGAFKKDDLRNPLYEKLLEKAEPLVQTWREIYAAEKNIFTFDILETKRVDNFYRDVRSFIEFLVYSFSVVFGAYTVEQNPDLNNVKLKQLSDIALDRIHIDENISAIEKLITSERQFKSRTSKRIIFKTLLADPLSVGHVWQLGEFVTTSVDRDISTFFASARLKYDHLEKLIAQSTLLQPQQIIDISAEIRTNVSVLESVQLKTHMATKPDLTNVLAGFYSLTQSAVSITEKIRNFMEITAKLPNVVESDAEEIERERERKRQRGGQQQPTSTTASDDDDAQNLQVLTDSSMLPSKTKIGDEEINEDELRAVFARAMKMYLAERRMKK